MMREKLVKVLERGKESATQMRRLIDHHHHDDHDYDELLKLMKGQADAHTLEVLTSFACALSILHYSLSLDDDHDDDHQVGLGRLNPTLPHHYYDLISQVFEDWDAPKTPKDARGCYKRRKTEQPVEIETQNTEDGYAWRKYGQKSIQHTKYPRHYYRCTHKTDQGCQATKQVQQISENPPNFKIIYHGHHTCKNPLKTPSSHLDPFDDDKHNSSIFLSFEKSNTPKHALNPFVFASPLSLSPLSSSSSTTTSASSGSPMSNAMVELEYTSIIHEIPSEPSDDDHNRANFFQIPSSSSSDLTSLTEVYSSVVSPHGALLEEYSYIMDHEFIDFSQMFQDNYQLLSILNDDDDDHDQ